MRSLTFDEVVELIRRERQHQDEKWGSLDSRSQSIPGFIEVLEGELAEAKLGWLKNIEGKHSALAEMVQVAAVAFACIEKHGASGNLDVTKHEFDVFKWDVRNLPDHLELLAKWFDAVSLPGWSGSNEVQTDLRKYASTIRDFIKG